MDKLRLRQSFIKTWAGCPLQAKFDLDAQTLQLGRGRQNAAASLGTCVHHALGKYDEGLTLEETIAEFIKVWANPSLLGVDPTEWPKFSSVEKYTERGIQMIQNYHDKLQWESRDVIKVEHTFAVPFGEFILDGTVDLIEARKTGRGVDILRIVDKKTNSKKPNADTLRYDLQFTVYVYASLQREFWVGCEDTPGIENGDALFERFKDVPRRGIWNHLKTGEDVDVGPRDQGDFERLYRICLEIKKALDLQVFVPNISGTTCVYCDHREACGVKIPTQQELELDESRWT